MTTTLATLRESDVLPVPRPANSSRFEQSVRRLLILAALFALPARAVLQPVIDPDIWWHIRTGEWIAEHRAVPRTDPFSSYGQGKPWVAYSWLFELLVYSLYTAFGLAGIMAYRAVLIFAVALTFYRLLTRLDPRFLWPTVLTGLAMTAFIPLWSERPWLLTILFTIWTFRVVLDLRQRKAARAVWWLPLAYVLWANLHIQFVYGLLVLALACAAPVVDRFLFAGRRQTAKLFPFDVIAWRRLLYLTAACTAATALNPYGLRLYGVVLEYAIHPVAYALVDELNAFSFRHVWDWTVLGLAGLAAFTLGRRWENRAGVSVSCFDVMMLAAAGYFAFHAQRDLWLLVLVSTTILAANDIRPTEHDMFSAKPVTILTASILALLVVAFVGWKKGDLTAERYQDEIALRYPVGAADFVVQEGIEGPLFNTFNWGGFLIWKLPHCPVSLDGRTNLHGDDRIRRLVNTWRGRGWKSDPELEEACVVIAPVKEPLTFLLRSDPRFEKRYEDRVAVVFVRRDGK